MINIKNAKQYCKDNISLIENYDKAISDNTQIWHLHHRLELTLDNEYALSKQDLVRHGMYYKRPYFELIFMTAAEHRALHNSAMNKRPEVIKAHKIAFDNNPGMHREHWTDEEKLKLKHLGVPMPKKRKRSPFCIKYGMTKRELADKYNIPAGSMNWYMISGKLDELINRVGGK